MSELEHSASVHGVVVELSPMAVSRSNNEIHYIAYSWPVTWAERDIFSIPVVSGMASRSTAC